MGAMEQLYIVSVGFQELLGVCFPLAVNEVCCLVFLVWRRRISWSPQMISDDARKFLPEKVR